MGEWFKGRDWKSYDCDTCGCCFIVLQDEEHNKKNTCCPECRCIVQAKADKKEEVKEE